MNLLGQPRPRGLQNGEPVHHVPHKARRAPEGGLRDRRRERGDLHLLHLLHLLHGGGVIQLGWLVVRHFGLFVGLLLLFSSIHNGRVRMGRAHDSGARVSRRRIARHLSVAQLGCERLFDSPKSPGRGRALRSRSRFVLCWSEELDCWRGRTGGEERSRSSLSY